MASHAESLVIKIEIRNMGWAVGGNIMANQNDKSEQRGAFATAATLLRITPMFLTQVETRYCFKERKSANMCEHTLLPSSPAVCPG